MTEDNVMEFCQWLVSEKGIEAGNLSDYINNNEEEVLKLAQEFKKPKFKVGGKVEAAAEMFKCGGKAEEKQDGGKMNRKEYKANKTSRKDLKNAANDRGYSDDQFSKSYYTLKDSFRNNGLSRRNAKLAAQRVIMGDNTTAAPVDVAPTEPIYSYSRPSAPTYSWEPDKFYEGFDDMQFEITPVRRKATAKPEVTKRDPLVFSEIVTPAMNNANSMASFINPLNNKIYLRNNSVPSDIIDGGVMEDIIVTAPGIVDGGMIDEVVVTVPGKSSKNSKFRTKTMPGRFGLAHYQGGGQVYKNLRLPKENLELIVDKGDSIVMRTPNPANGNYTYIKRKGEQNWSGNMQSSMGDFEEFKKEQANAEARRIVNMFKKPAKFDDGGEVDGYKITGNETSSTESFVRDNGDSIFLTRRSNTFPGYNGADSIIRIKPVSGNEIIMHNMPYDGTREWKGFDLSNMKEINPMKLKTEALNDLFKEKLNFKKNHR